MEADIEIKIPVLNDAVEEIEEIQPDATLENSRAISASMNSISSATQENKKKRNFREHEDTDSESEDGKSRENSPKRTKSKENLETEMIDADDKSTGSSSNSSLSHLGAVGGFLQPKTPLVKTSKAPENPTFVFPSTDKRTKEQIEQVEKEDKLKELREKREAEGRSKEEKNLAEKLMANSKPEDEDANIGKLSVSLAKAKNLVTPLRNTKKILSKGNMKKALKSCLNVHF